jgi:hypothetical protein
MHGAQHEAGRCIASVSALLENDEPHVATGNVHCGSKTEGHTGGGDTCGSCEPPHPSWGRRRLQVLLEQQQQGYSVAEPVAECNVADVAPPRGFYLLPDGRYDPVKDVCPVHLKNLPLDATPAQIPCRLAN